DTRIGAGRRIEHDGAVREADELVACTQGPPLASHCPVPPNAEARDIVVEFHVETVSRSRGAALAQPVDELVANEPAGLALDRADLDRAERRSHGTRTPTAVQRLQSARGK